MEQRFPRKLAAILYADVVGYSRLTGEDEEGTHRRLSEYLGLISASVEQHEGKVVHYAGDAVLADFGTVTDALTCATAVQRDLQDRNKELPDDRKVRFRIGVNLGEVIVDRDDIYGDGVNVAARLESLADPGGICISESVHTAIGNKLPLRYEFMGEQQVKNIAKPVQAYRVVMDAEAKPKAMSLQGQAPETLDKPTIAVLPFDNLSGDPEQEYFSDGITEDIITDLSKISALFVIARNSSFVYKGKTVDVKQVAKDLGVRYVVEGSVRKAANRVRITAQLIDGITGGHLWAERYDRDLHDIFLVQDEVTQHIVEALRVRLSPDERDRIGAASTRNVEAYDFALRGRELLLRFTADTNAEAQTLFEKAIEMDSKFSTAYSMLAVTLLTNYINNWNDATEETLERGLRLAMTAVELDPRGSQGYWALALAHMWKRDLDRAIAEIEKAVALDPNNSHALASRGHIFSYAGRAVEAIESLENSMRLDPHYPHLHLHFLAHAHFVQGNYAEAVALLKRRIRLHPETDTSRVLLASCFGHLGRENEAKKAWGEAITINPSYSLERKARILPYKNPADWDRFMEGLRKAGLPE
ncbi:MAG: tetratricopeptide repeat protein [Gammaproteobacteria bacterium]|nr:tetratricopeptide repeat protein [Gammaproteobacteria bacterium]NIR81686.1 tetratricopeptide repeat protein [Gammaproteobacteria bacterium]NIR88249.1 tetratricopeptide repeat protein [Gammaproteobacteria bacterium]NIU02788.1 tetratricopeptide repeat protein [Gammaproteobacteria bacterium]NIV50312.1 tetratricopeptide repeat protein [Gammaproteobacteria bacterium]